MKSLFERAGIESQQEEICGCSSGSVLGVGYGLTIVSPIVKFTAMKFVSSPEKSYQAQANGRYMVRISNWSVHCQ